MRYVCLNPRLNDTAQKMHQTLRETLGFPDYYGMNLDALYDVLTETDEDISALCLRFTRDDRAVYPFAEGFFRVFEDAAQANPRLRVDRIDVPTV